MSTMRRPSYVCVRGAAETRGPPHKRHQERARERDHTMPMISTASQQVCYHRGNDFWRKGTLLTPDSVSGDRRAGPGAAAGVACRYCRMRRAWAACRPSLWRAQAWAASRSSTAITSNASNLQRQFLFEESDAADALPKAAAAERRLRRINSGIEIHGMVADLNPSNAEELLGGAGVILDGTDNFETRYLINDFAVSRGMSLDLRRGGFQLRPHDAGDSRAHSVPAVRLSGSSMRHATYLRHGRRAEARSRRRSRRSAGGGRAEDFIRPV